MGVKVPENKSLRKRNFPRTFIPGSEKARKQKGHGAKWPGSYWPIRSRERIGPGAKRLGTCSTKNKRGMTIRN